LSGVAVVASSVVPDDEVVLSSRSDDEVEPVSEDELLEPVSLDEDGELDDELLEPVSPDEDGELDDELLEPVSLDEEGELMPLEDGELDELLEPVSPIDEDELEEVLERFWSASLLGMPWLPWFTPLVELPDDIWNVRISSIDTLPSWFVSTDANWFVSIGMLLASDWSSMLSWSRSALENCSRIWLSPCCALYARTSS